MTNDEHTIDAMNETADTVRVAITEHTLNRSKELGADNFSRVADETISILLSALVETVLKSLSVLSANDETITHNALEVVDALCNSLRSDVMDGLDEAMVRRKKAVGSALDQMAEMGGFEVPEAIRGEIEEYLGAKLAEARWSSPTGEDDG